MGQIRFTLRPCLFITACALGILANFRQAPIAIAQAPPYCQQNPDAIAQKEQLRQSALRGNREAAKRYRALVIQHGEGLRRCRSRTAIQTQAIWIRLYPCDARPGKLEAVLDQIVNRGYNQVNVETFYNGRVMLPVSDNPTAWQSTLAGTSLENADLLALAIQKGHERGLKVYSWLFSLNFGASYARRPDKQQTIARNGLGQTSLTANTIAGLSVEYGQVNPEEAFIDPYSPQARQDYIQMVRAVLRRKPDGVLFDYIRYPRGNGSASVVGKVQDLWIYGSASGQTLLQRALNPKGLDLMQRYLNRGYITADDLKAVNQIYPQDREPLWQGLNLDRLTGNLPLPKQTAILQDELWRLATAHTYQGVLDFLAMAVTPVLRQGIPAGAVFFPEGNTSVGRSGLDSRMQPWDKFPAGVEWHPMSYAVCGEVNCIVAQVQRVLSMAPPGTAVKPVLAGIWQMPISHRPPLEAQMQAIAQVAPQIRSLSHFAFSWQEPGSDRDRKFCQP
jgi:hypothetical protein